MADPEVPLLNNCFRVDVQSAVAPRSRHNIAVASIRGLRSNADATISPHRGMYSWLRRRRKPTALRVELRRAQDGDRFFYDWHVANLGRGVDLRTVTITHLNDSTSNTVNQWQLIDCWVCEWRGPDFDAIDVNLAYETLTLCYGRVQWVEII